jgi:hypothetical protein
MKFPAIEQALAVGQVSGTKVNIAFALGELGNASGVDALKRSCHDSGMEPVFRVRAAQYMLDLRSNACLRDTLDLLELRYLKRPNGGFIAGASIQERHCK